MGLYSKPALDLLGALINRDNPNLKIPLSSDNIMLLGGPYTTGLGTSGRNSRVVINGKTGSNVVGKMEFFYDRLNISDLFKNITVVFEGDGSATKVADLLPALNEQYGIHLTTDDITNGTAAIGFGYTPTAVTFTISATSLVYRGALSVTWKRKPAGNYPDSGPGPKTMLMGDMTEGYFGVVSQAELATTASIYSEMFSGIATAATPTVDGALYWLKFALDGKIVYFPNRNLISNTSWNEINSIGGVNADRKIPLILTNDNGMDALFQMRLPKLTAADPVAAAYRNDPDSEIVRLFNKVHTGAYNTGAWDALATFNVAEQFIQWNRSTYQAGAGTPTYGFTQTANFGNVNTQVLLSGKYGWRPLLVLADAKDYILPMRNLQGEVVLPVPRIDFFIDSERDPNMLLPMENIEGNLYLKFPAPFVQSVDYNTNTAMQNVSGTKAIPSIVATFTATYDRRFDLSTANAELDGF